MKLRQMLSACMLASLMLVACSNGQEAAQGDSDSYKVGGNFELSGQVANYGIAMDKAVTLAVEEINSNNGINGKKVNYVHFDNKSEKTETASIGTKLMTEENVVGVVGPATTGNAQAQIPVAEKYAVPVIYPAATGDGLTLQPNGSVYEYIYRTCFVDSMQGTLGAQIAEDKFEAKKAVIIVDNTNDYSKNMAENFKKNFSGKIVAEEVYQEQATDFKAILTSIKNKDFDILFIPGYYNEVGLIIKQAREMGINQPILGGDGLGDAKLAELAGVENMKDIYYLSAFYPQNKSDKVQTFVKAFKEKYNEEPNQFAALAYDSMMLLAKAIEKAGSADSKAISKALAETKDFEGVTGTFSFDKNHDPVKSVTLISVQGDKVTAEEVSLHE